MESDKKAIVTCSFFMPRKNRCCKFQAVKGFQFCGNHLHGATGQGNAMIPCPIDPTHSIQASKLESHVVKCTKAKQQDSLKAQPYYVYDIHAGSDDDPDLGEEQVEEQVRRNPFGPGRAARRAVYARRLGQAAIESLIIRVEKVYKEVCFELPSHIEMPDECTKAMKVAADGSRPYREKHASQYASILGNVRRYGLLPDVTKEGNGEGEKGLEIPAVVELGAGKGWLSFMLAECWGPAIKSIVLVDNRGFQNKADKSLRSIDHLARITIDIKDLDISSCPGLDKGQEWIAIGKHCCGASTDYGLRCCSLGSKKGLVGLAIAPCCHHRCGWKAYVGKRSMIRWGFSPQEFELISWMTGWALCGHGSSSNNDGKASKSSNKEEKDSDEGGEDQEGGGGDADLEPAGKRKRSEGGDDEGDTKPFIEIARETKQRVGAMAKRLIDAGRIEWIKERGCTTQAVVYTADSGESQLILAKPDAVEVGL